MLDRRRFQQGIMKSSSAVDTMWIDRGERNRVNVERYEELPWQDRAEASVLKSARQSCDGFLGGQTGY